MGWGMFRRSARLPAALRPTMARDERIVAWAATADDGALVVTNLGMWLPGRDHRLGWHQVHKAAWSGQTLAVTPAEVTGERDGYEIVADQPTVTVDLPDPGEVPNQVRARVTRSVGYTAHQRLDGGGLRVVARRVPGVDGLTWTVRYDPGADPDALSAETADLVAAARASVEVEP